MVEALTVIFSSIAIVGPANDPANDSISSITLVYNGQTVRHEVHDSMPISRLMAEAGGIFSIDHTNIILMLFIRDGSGKLDRYGFIYGPPRVTSNSTVFVFLILPTHADSVPGTDRRPVLYGSAPVPFPSSASTTMSSKLLGTFKLPKFDGSPRHWKIWERSLQRYLGLHQLDYVLQAGFLASLPYPDAVNANKVVYFLIEEPVAIGTLATK